MPLSENVTKRRRDRISRMGIKKMPLWMIALFMFMGSPIAQSVGTPPLDPNVGPQALIEATTKQLFHAIKTERHALRAHPARMHELLSDILFPHIDFERITRFVLGRHWRNTTPAQRTRLMQALSMHHLRTFATALTEHTDPVITYLANRSRVTDDRAVVRTVMSKSDGTSVSVDYRLHRGDHGQWKVYDVLIDGISLVTNYRAVVSAELSNRGVDHLIRRLAN